MQERPHAEKGTITSYRLDGLPSELKRNSNLNNFFKVACLSLSIQNLLAIFAIWSTFASLLVKFLVGRFLRNLVTLPMEWRTDIKVKYLIWLYFVKLGGNRSFTPSRSTVFTESPDPF